MMRDKNIRGQSFFSAVEAYQNFEEQLRAIAEDLEKCFIDKSQVFNALLDCGLVAKPSVNTFGIVKWTMKDIATLLQKITGFTCKVTKLLAAPASLSYKQYCLYVYRLCYKPHFSAPVFLPSCAPKFDQEKVFSVAQFKYCYFIQFYNKETESESKN